MPDPISFTSASPRFGLPLLFAGQAQKEFFVNQAHALADALLHPAIEGESDAPPGSPTDGECWLVGDAPSGEWSGHTGKLACRQAGTWVMVSPQDGMRLLDKATGQDIRYHGAWLRASAPPEPTGGSVADIEARAAVAGLVAALVAAGVLPES